MPAKKISYSKNINKYRTFSENDPYNVSSIYNINNSLIKKEDVRKLVFKYVNSKEVSKEMNTLLYKVNDVGNIDDYVAAMTHESYVSKNVSIDPSKAKNKMKKFASGVKLNVLEKLRPYNAIPLQNKSYQRLEFLGDKILRAILGIYIFRRYPEEDEGFMTTLCIELEKGPTQSEIAKKIGLAHFILMSSSVEKTNGRNSKSMCSDTFESFLGALFLNMGFYVCKHYVDNLLESEVDIAKILSKDTNYKTQLSEYFLKKYGVPAVYEDMETSSDKTFRVCVKGVKGSKKESSIIAIGIGNTKKDAQKACARKALIKFGEIDTDSDSDDDDTTLKTENKNTSTPKTNKPTLNNTTQYLKNNKNDKRVRTVNSLFVTKSHNLEPIFSTK